MNRVAGFAIALLGMSLLGCAASRRNLEVPEGCVGTDARTYTVEVDRDGRSKPECLVIHKQLTDVDWQGAADLRLLGVAFTRGNAPLPRDPACTGPKCRLGRGATAGLGEFKYSVVVLRRDGSVGTVDPMLIIQP